MSQNFPNATTASASASACENSDNNNDNNPLLKVVFISKILLFVQQKGIIVITCFFGREMRRVDSTTRLDGIPRVFQLRHVSSHWSETIDYYTSSLDSDVVSEFCQYLQDFVEKKHSKSEKHATVARDALLWISKYIISDAESVEVFCRCVWWIIFNNQKANKRIFGTEQVRDAFVMIAEFFAASDEKSNDWWCDSIYFLTDENEFNQKLFADSTEILKCFVSLSKVVSSSNSCYIWSRAFSTLTNITELKENRQLFGTEELRDAMIRVFNKKNMTA